MRSVPFTILFITLLAVPGLAQKRSAPKKDPTFAEAVEIAKKAFDEKEHGAAVSALQAAIRAVQKLQRTSILDALPKPEGFTFKDDEAPDESANPFGAGMAALGMTVTRHYRKGDDKTIDIEVTANSPMVQMMSMMLSNPTIIKADGGELVEYGAHKAMLKKSGDSGQELTLLMHDKHTIKATAQGLSAEELLAIINQAFVDRMEKPLGK